MGPAGTRAGLHEEWGMKQGNQTAGRRVGLHLNDDRRLAIKQNPTLERDCSDMFVRLSPPMPPQALTRVGD